MTTYPLASLAAQVSATGITAPSYDDAYLSLCASYRAIYGSDVVLTPDTQDGQWIGILAQAITDTNAAAVAVYNSFSPATAQGTGLSSVVKINGLKREASSFSTCPVLITGTAGTTITNGSVADSAGNVWSLPPTVVIPPSASITVTASCRAAGAIAAPVDTITQIRTPTRGWLSVMNIVAAAAGVAVESDARLRKRQSISTALPAKSPMESIAAAVANVPGVSRLNYSENATNLTNADGVPPHSFCMVVEGGDATAIVQTIATTKSPGTGTFGTVSRIVFDDRGIPATIAYDVPTYLRIVANLSVKALPGYTVSIGNTLVQAIADFITGLSIGAEVDINNVVAEAIERTGARGTFKIPAGGLTLGIYGTTPAATDLPVAFNQAATCAVGDVSLSLVS